MNDRPSPIVGIDLGTTYSLVVVLRDGVPTLLPNALGKVLTPSAVSLGEDGKLLVGAPARSARPWEPPSPTSSGLGVTGRGLDPGAPGVPQRNRGAVPQELIR